MLFAVAGLSLALMMGSAADVTGKWDGKVTGQRPDGSAAEDTALLILVQKDKTVTGTVGGSESDQHAITSGTLEGNKLSLVAKNAQNGREFRIELTVGTDEMTGTFSSGERTAKLAVKKRKE